MNTTEIDHQCARCGSSCGWLDCTTCGGDGRVDGRADDPLWWDDGDGPLCDVCDGAGGWHVCLSGEEWCQAHPLDGRDGVERGTVESFEVPR